MAKPDQHRKKNKAVFSGSLFIHIQDYTDELKKNDILLHGRKDFCIFVAEIDF